MKLYTKKTVFAKLLKKNQKGIEKVNDFLHIFLVSPQFFVN